MEVEKLKLNGNSGTASVTNYNYQCNEICRSHYLELIREANEARETVRQLQSIIEIKTNVLLEYDTVIKDIIPKIYQHLSPPILKVG